jgi:acetyl esterase/lipase
MELNKSNDGFKSQVQGQLAILKLLLPKLPFILRVILMHVFHMSEPAKYMDLRSDVTVSFMRDMIVNGDPQPLSKSQALSIRDPGIKGRIWISSVVSQAPPELSVRDTLLAAIDSMKKDLVPSDGECRIPKLVPVTAEWTGYRANVKSDSKLPAISEQAKYTEMMKECKNAITVLYFHGGAYYLLDPSSHRPATKRIAKLTGGRVYSVRYRLAPQNPFPAAMLDGLVTYLNLLYPPPGSIHDAVQPGNIVISGDRYV